MMNLRFMCHCLARAVKMHLDFNVKNARFLQDLADEDILAFTYNFKQGLKLTLNPQVHEVVDSQNIDKQLIEINAKL